LEWIWAEPFGNGIPGDGIVAHRFEGGEQISDWRFLKVGLVVMPRALAAARLSVSMLSR
jgi:hypothetical protein